VRNGRVGRESRTRSSLAAPRAVSGFPAVPCQETAVASGRVLLCSFVSLKNVPRHTCECSGAPNLSSAAVFACGARASGFWRGSRSAPNNSYFNSASPAGHLGGGAELLGHSWEEYCLPAGNAGPRLPARACIFAVQHQKHYREIARGIREHRDGSHPKQAAHLWHCAPCRVSNIPGPLPPQLALPLPHKAWPCGVKNRRPLCLPITLSVGRRSFRHRPANPEWAQTWGAGTRADSRA